METREKKPRMGDAEDEGGGLTLPPGDEEEAAGSLTDLDAVLQGGDAEVLTPSDWDATDAEMQGGDAADYSAVTSPSLDAEEAVDAEDEGGGLG